MKVVYSSGNLIVDEVGKIQLMGNIIPERHFKAVMTGYGKLPNIMFLELFPETLKRSIFKL